MPELYALRKLDKRPATEEELETTTAFFKRGHGSKESIGILFIHGFTVTPANFRQYADRFAELGYTVSVPLLPGHGETPASLLDVTWWDWLDAVVTAYDGLKAECRCVFVVGISLGGALALHLAYRRDDIGKLYLLAPAVYPIPLLKIATLTLMPLLKRFGVRYWIHVAGDVKDTDGFELGYGSTPIHGLEQLAACMRATQKIVPKITTDVLIFQGRVDHEVPARKAKTIYGRIGSPRRELVWLQDSFHEIPRDNDSELVFERIRRDLEAMLPS